MFEKDFCNLSHLFITSTRCFRSSQVGKRLNFEKKKILSENFSKKNDKPCRNLFQTYLSPKKKNVTPLCNTDHFIKLLKIVLQSHKNFWEDFCELLDQLYLTGYKSHLSLSLVLIKFLHSCDLT